MRGPPVLGLAINVHRYLFLQKISSNIINLNIFFQNSICGRVSLNGQPGGLLYPELKYTVIEYEMNVIFLLIEMKYLQTIKINDASTRRANCRCRSSHKINQDWNSGQRNNNILEVYQVLRGVQSFGQVYPLFNTLPKVFIFRS